jgi:large subunit ribosomal protein L29
MKASDLRQKSLDELKSESEKLMAEQFKLRMQHSLGKLQQTHQLKVIRRDVARINTIVTEKSRKQA